MTSKHVELLNDQFKDNAEELHDSGVLTSLPR